ncbi:hypothetical protein HOY82DRAFT_179051 [Tuber indicum]|nr:hypothetical protein HOY82DRAFT_179051 [Tuber indicum]
MCRHITLQFNCDHYRTVLCPSTKSCYTPDKRLVIETDSVPATHDIVFSLVPINSLCRWCMRQQDTTAEVSVNGVAPQANRPATTSLATIPEEMEVQGDTVSPQLVSSSEDIDFTLTPLGEGRAEAWWTKHDKMDVDATWAVSPPVPEEVEEMEWSPNAENAHTLHAFSWPLDGGMFPISRNF